MIAQHLAVDHPRRVRSLVLGCTTAGGQRGAPPWRLIATAALRPLLGSRLTFPLIAPALYARRTLEQNPGRVRQDLERRMAESTSPITTYAQMGAISGHDTRTRLGALAEIPTLVLHGLEDSLVPPRHGRDLAELIPGAKLVLVPGCGHILGTDAEAETAGAILEHLDRSKAPAPAQGV
jgi:pimeloyl-ACP methyl ester carboxylesterase